MNQPFSIYLDLVRFLAACFVYVYHSNQRWLVAEVLPLAHYGHAAVIVFFVLSGYVIAWVTHEKEDDWRSYAASRLSRVFSVVVPALALCLLLDGIGRQFWSLPYGGYPYDQHAIRLAASLLMLNEWWFLSITSLSNVPYWSITYEFWYYVLFGIVVFLPQRVRWWAAGGLLILLGPKFALLAPIWMSGVLLYRWKRLYELNEALAWMLFVGSTSLIIYMHATGAFDAISDWFKQLIGGHYYDRLTFSKFFLADYLLGFLVFLNFAGVRRVACRMAPVLLLLQRPVQWLAGFTFTFYLLHQPLFLFWGSILRGDAGSKASWMIVTTLVAISVFLVGQVTERRRPALRRLLQSGLERIPPSWVAVTPRA
jgi:peptidoglycan/LPS O-acetylase OafA/YrhL